MSVVDYALGLSEMLVGVEREDEDSVRVYINARWKGIYFIATGADAERAEQVWNGTSGHVTIRKEQIGRLMKDGEFIEPPLTTGT